MDSISRLWQNGEEAAAAGLGIVCAAAARPLVHGRSMNDDDEH